MHAQFESAEHIAVCMDDWDDVHHETQNVLKEDGNVISIWIPHFILESS